LFAEIRRRKVVPVIVTYAVVGWLVLQIAGITFEPLGFPDWGIRVLIIVTIAGFPAVFFLTWLIDFTEQGMMFDLPLWPSESESPEQPKKSGKALAILLCVFVIAGTSGLVVLLLDQIPEPKHDEVAETENFTIPLNSIAVLAFDNFYGKSDSDYFSAGLAEEILNLLAGMQELNVAARTSSFRFRGEQVDIREVAKRLNVKHVLEGSVRREGERIRVTAQLIDGVEGFNEWSKTYDRKLFDIFAIQQEIAAAVVNELKIALSVASENRLLKTHTENIDAYIFYLQGREKLHSSLDGDAMKVAIQLFNQAISIEPSYSRAYAGICEAQLRLYEISNSPDDFTDAEQVCGQAKELSNENSSEVQIALGRLYRFRGLYAKAVGQLNSAIANSPTSVDAYIELGEVLAKQGKLEEAEKTFLRGLDLKRNYWKAHEALANFYFITERYQDSINAYEVVTRLTPDSSLGFGGLGAAYWMMGNTQQALSAYEDSLHLKPSPQAYTNLGSLYYYDGQFQNSVKMQKQALEFVPDDHRVWGKLAASLRFVNGQESESLAAYQKAVKLALNNLEINSEDWLTRGQLGLYYSYLEQTGESFELLQQAVDESQRNSEVLYLQALSYLSVDESKIALDILEEAVEKDDYYRLFIGLDPDLQILKENPRFLLLLPKQLSQKTGSTK